MRTKLWWFPAILLLAGLATILLLMQIPVGASHSGDAPPRTGSASSNPS